MLQKVESKIKNGAEKMGNFCKDHIFEICVGTGCAIGGVACIMSFKHKNNSYHIAWQKALNAYRNKDANYDYGPYKIAKFIDPKTLETIGDTVMHGETVELFLNVK